MTAGRGETCCDYAVLPIADAKTDVTVLYELYLFPQDFLISLQIPFGSGQLCSQILFNGSMECKGNKYSGYANLNMMMMNCTVSLEVCKAYQFSYNK